MVCINRFFIFFVRVKFKHKGKKKKTISIIKCLKKIRNIEYTSQNVIFGG